MQKPYLVHRLPWESLGEVVFAVTDPGRSRKLRLKEHEKKTVDHFSRCLADAIKEFAESDTSTEDEKVWFDPNRSGVWRVEYPLSRGGFTGYYDSLLQGYVYLNLFLLDPDKFRCLMSGHQSYLMSILCGHHDGGHPQWLADHLSPVFERRRFNQPMTAEVAAVLREHCKLLFRCLYTISGHNRVMDWEFVSSYIGLDLLARYSKRTSLSV